MVATAHIQAINAGNLVQVISIYSSRELKDEKLSQEWGSEIISYNDLDKMLNDKKIDAVSICSYSYQHKDDAIAAAKARKHIYIRKANGPLLG